MELTNSPTQIDEAEGPFSTVTTAFHHHVKTSPTCLAVRELSETPRELTYQQLAERTQLLTQRLRHEGVLPGQRIPFVVTRGVDMIVGIWAILFCGAQYVPLDGQVVSDEAISRVLKETQASFVLCLGSTEHRVLKLQTSCTVILVDREEPNSPPRADDSFVDLAISGGGCYAAYISGRFEIEINHETNPRITNTACSRP